MVLAGKTLVQEDIDILYEHVLSKKRVTGSGLATSLDIVPEYIHRIVQDIRLTRPLKVVVDCGNGIAGPVIPEVIRTLGCEVIPLYCDVDGRFPNHHPDPTIEANLVDLKNAVAAHKADLGFAFDGDADRLGLVTNQGEVIWPDRLMIVYAQELLHRIPGATIVFDVKCSKHLAESVKAAGGIAKMCPTGHSIVKGLMKKEGAALAGEMSGHLFFKDRWYGFDDALYSACRLLEIVSASPLSVSDQFALIPDSINTPEIKIAVPEAEKFGIIARFIKEARFPDAEISTIDGLRVEFSTGWGLLRASNTTPCLIARFEADTETDLQWIQDQFKSQLQTLNQHLCIAF
jgi:phosphomannomutase/phosphomannomutase/phosphoglucomutase